MKRISSQTICYLERRIDNPDLVEAHPDVLDPGVEGDGQHVQGGVGADHPQPRVMGEYSPKCAKGGSHCIIRIFGLI